MRHQECQAFINSKHKNFLNNDEHSSFIKCVDLIFDAVIDLNPSSLTNIFERIFSLLFIEDGDEIFHKATIQPILSEIMEDNKLLEDILETLKEDLTF